MSRQNARLLHDARPGFYCQTDPDLPVVVVTVKDLQPREIRALERRRVLGILRKAPDTAARAAGTIAHALDLLGPAQEDRSD